MVIRELQDGSSLASTQEDHADLAAQFAAHWGNDGFAQLSPYDTMVFATTYHDSGYREWEGVPPMNIDKGRPYGHRETIPSFEPTELEAYRRNIDWVRAHDVYAGVIVSMHRTGLWQSRYEVLTKPRPKVRERGPAVKAALRDLEAQQQDDKQLLAESNSRFEDGLWINYRLLQVFDLLSLYFCCDGHANESLKEEHLGPVPLSYTGKEAPDLCLAPLGANKVRMDPFPFDVSPLRVFVRARTLPPGTYATEEKCREAYYKAPLSLLTFEITE